MAELIWCLHSVNFFILINGRTALLNSWLLFIFMTFVYLEQWQNCFGAFLTISLYGFVAEMCLLNDDFYLLLCGRTALVPSWWQFLYLHWWRTAWCLHSVNFFTLFNGRTALLPSWLFCLSWAVVEMLWCLLDNFSIWLCDRNVSSQWQFLSVALWQNCLGAFMMTIS